MSSVVEDNNDICYVCKDKNKKAYSCKCKRIKYCSVECQKKDRKRHMKEDKCKFFKSNKSKEKESFENYLKGIKEKLGDNDSDEINIDKFCISLFEILNFIKSKEEMCWDIIWMKMYPVYLKNKGKSYEEIYNEILKLDSKIFHDKESKLIKELVYLWCIQNKNNRIFQYNFIKFIESYFESKLNGDISPLIKKIMRSYDSWLDDTSSKDDKDVFFIIGGIIKKSDRSLGMFVHCPNMDSFEDDVIILNSR